MLSSCERHLPSSLHMEGTAAIPFVNDPVRSQTLSLTVDLISPLNGQHFLSTRLVDFILQQAMKQTILELCPYRNIFVHGVLPLYEQKTVNDKSLDVIRRKYLPYSSNRFHFLAANCINSHFNIWDAFQRHSGEISPGWMTQRSHRGSV
jgi:hypothetical protein